MSNCLRQNLDGASRVATQKGFKVSKFRVQNFEMYFYGKLFTKLDQSIMINLFTFDFFYLASIVLAWKVAFGLALKCSALKVSIIITF